MYKQILWIVTVLFSFTCSQVVSADAWGCGEGMNRMVESLKLDDAQKAKIKPILEQLKSTMKENGTRMMDLDKQINQLVESTNEDSIKVDGLIDKKASMIGNMMKAKFKAKNQIFSLLNVQQKNEIQNRMKKLEEKISETYKKCHEQD
jgi:protein CpxP